MSWDGDTDRGIQRPGRGSMQVGVTSKLSNGVQGIPISIADY